MAIHKVSIIPEKLGVPSMVFKGIRLGKDPVEIPERIARILKREYPDGLKWEGDEPKPADPDPTPAERLAARRAMDAGQPVDQLRSLSELALKILRGKQAVEKIKAGELDGERELVLVYARITGSAEIEAAIKERI